MKFDPLHCPFCGEPAAAVMQLIPGKAFLSLPVGDRVQWDGETEVLWGEGEDVVDDRGRTWLTCSDGHKWPAVQTED